MEELLETMMEDNLYEEQEETALVESPQEEEAFCGVEKIADLIDASPQTVRNYAKDYDEFLTVRRSDTGARTFTRRDAAIIKRIHEFRQQGMEKGEIKRYLERNRKTSPTVKRESQMIAAAVSEQLQERIHAFFEIGMKGISAQINKMSSHIDTMEGSVKRQKEEILKLQAQNEELHKAVQENDRLIKKLSLDAEKRDAKNADLLIDAKRSVDNLTQATEENDERHAKTNEKIEIALDEARQREQSYHEQMVLMIERALGSTPENTNDEDLQALQAENERAKRALLKLAGELDEKNRIIQSMRKNWTAAEIITTEKTMQISAQDPIKGLKTVAAKPKKTQQSPMKQMQELITGFKLRKNA